MTNQMISNELEWIVTEQVLRVNGTERALLNYNSKNSKWYAVVGEAFSNNKSDNLFEDEEFDHKVDAEHWVKDRLTARGYVGESDRWPTRKK